LAWIIKYTDSARKQLKKFDKQSAVRILDFMDEPISEETNPRASRKILKRPKLGSYWRYRVGRHRIICDFKMGSYVFWLLKLGVEKILDDKIQNQYQLFESYVEIFTNH
jgi:mRNA interferase RelE/StbE